MYHWLIEQKFQSSKNLPLLLDGTLFDYAEFVSQTLQQSEANLVYSDH